MSSTVGIAVLGMGRHGVSRIQRILASCKGLELHCVADHESEAAAKHLKQSLPSSSMPEVMKPWQLEEACRINRVTALIVLTPQVTVNTIRRALHHGMSVMCDHPVSLNTAALLACYEAAKLSNKTLLYAPLRRYDPTMISLRQHIDRGDVGHVTSIHSSARYDPAPKHGATGSIFRDCVSGEVDAISWLLKVSPTTVHASEVDMSAALAPNTISASMYGNQDEAVSTALRFPGGTQAHIEVWRSDVPHDQHMDIRGTQGMLYLDPSHPHGTVLHSVTRSGTATSVIGGTQDEREEEAFVSAVEHFLDVLRGEAEPQLSVLDCVRAASVAAACQESHKINTATSKVAQELQRAEVLVNAPQWSKVLEPLHPNKWQEVSS